MRIPDPLPPSAAMNSRSVDLYFKSSEQVSREAALSWAHKAALRSRRPRRR
ncbi:hypothetical protein ACF3NT_14205 [Naumannella halotolerans]|uniref:Uncharacterized protein n=1 Tax=Naumannella halotolerans TaxID=993414 RepID=A0A4R7J0L8_9ACTN|nr:hypothetical protein [Naumannella halotolerans]TDT29823.1 hypothetical protein CLV29_2842 [Naumannella halotolerans]